MFEELDDDLQIDLTPLIDVIFMLVIFFVMTMTFSKPVMDVLLPQSTTSVERRENATLVLVVDSEGKLWSGEKELSREELPAFLETQPEALLNLFIDEKAPFEVFIAIVDQAKLKRGGKFVISTRKNQVNDDVRGS